MKYNKTIAVSLSAITLILVGSFIANAANPNQDGDNFSKRFGGGRQENHEAVIGAIESGDYTSWLEAVGSDSRQGQEVTVDEFPTLIEAHNLMQEGQAKFEEARELRESIGLNFSQGMKHGDNGKHQMKGFGNQADRQAVNDALEAGDYTAWLEAMGDSKATELVDQENFTKLVTAHNAMQSGDFETAKEIRDELGLPGGFGNRDGKKGFRQVQQ